MRIATKFALVFVPLFAVSSGALLWLTQRAVHEALVSEVQRRGAAVGSELARSAAAGFERRSETSLLQELQTVQDDPDVDFAAALDLDGLVLAHTNVAETGKRYVDPAMRRALAAPAAKGFEAAGGAPRLLVAIPVWKTEREAEAFVLGGEAERERLGTVLLALSLEETLEVQRRVLERLLLALAAIVGLMLAAGALIARPILRPIGELSRATTRIASGQYGPVRVATRDEIGELAVNFNRMIETLARTTVSKDYLDAVLANMLEPLWVLHPDGTIRTLNRAALELAGGVQDDWLGRPAAELFAAADRARFADTVLGPTLRGGAAAGSELAAASGKPLLLSGAPLRDPTGRLTGAILVAKDITDRKRAESELADRAKELSRSNADLEQFAYAASHDLQEPLRKITSYAGLLERRFGATLPEDAKRFLGHMTGAAGRMHDLIGSLLTYSRAGRRGPPAETTDLDKALEDALSDLETALAESGAVVVRAPLPRLRIHPTEVRQVLQNLIANGLKFRGQRAPRIEVGAKRDGAEWIVFVRDNGIGIEKQYLDQIFVLFKRLHSREEYPGTGIGLAMCKRIIERAGGRMWVESEPGEGSTFLFAFAAEEEASVRRPERRPREG